MVRLTYSDCVLSGANDAFPFLNSFFGVSDISYQLGFFQISISIDGIILDCLQVSFFSSSPNVLGIFCSLIKDQEQKILQN